MGSDDVLELLNDYHFQEVKVNDDGEFNICAARGDVRITMYGHSGGRLCAAWGCYLERWRDVVGFCGPLGYFTDPIAAVFEAVRLSEVSP